MNEFDFNKCLIKLHRNAMKLEEKKLKLSREINLTINEIHLLECIKSGTNGDEGPTISTIAAEMDITRPSATVAINKLALKKYVDKSGCANDGRSIRVKLTQKGDKAYNMHRKYHKSMLEELKSELGEDEVKVLAEYCKKIDKFLAAKLDSDDDDDEF